MVERVFLGWERPLIESAADWLASRFSTRVAGKGIDFQRVLVVVPGRRFGRELLARVVEIGEEARTWVSPGRVITPGELTGLLLDDGAERATGVLRAMAWGEALRRLPAEQFRAVLRRRPADASAGEWFRLGAMVDRSVGELAREMLTPEMVAARVAELPESGDSARWLSIAAAANVYTTLLSEKQDGHLARLEHLRTGAPVQSADVSEVVLIGVAELDRAAREAMTRSGVPLRALVFAPPSEEGAVDEFGCVTGDIRERVSIDSDALEFAHDLRDGARRVIGRIAAWSNDAPGKCAQDVSVCSPNAAGAIELSICAAGVEGLAFHDAAGEPVGRASVIKLLARLAEFGREGTMESFVPLLKRPEVEGYIERTLHPGAGWIERFDREALSRAGVPISGYQGPDDPISKAIVAMCEGLFAPTLGLAARLGSLLEVIERLYDGVELSEREAGAMSAIAGVVADCKGGEAWYGPIDGWRAIELVLEALADQRQAQTSRRGEVEVLGWLEAAVDRAPYVAILGINEGSIPSGRVEDPLLPESVRRALGIATGQMRAERDAFLLEGLIRSRAQSDRKAKGGVWFVCLKQDEKGNPLKPSRLLFRCEDSEAASRIEQMVEETPPPARYEAAARSVDANPKKPGDAFPITPMHEMEPPREVRVTAFKEYLRSPYVFFLKRVARLQEVDEPSPEADQSAMGVVLHDVLRGFGPQESGQLLREKDIAQWAVERLETILNGSSRQRDGVVHDIQVEVAKRRLRTFARVQAEHAAKGWRVHSTEREPTSAVVLETRHGPIGLRGRVDRIDRHGDEWLILDYKSSDRTEGPNRKHRKGTEWTDLQLPLYVLLLRSMEADAKKIQAGYFQLPKSSKEGKIDPAPWDDAMVEEAIERAREIAGLILKREYPLGDDPFEKGAFARLCGVSLIERAEQSEAEGGDE